MDTETAPKVPDFNYKRAILWALTILAWIALIAPGFMPKERESSELPIQGKMQAAIAGKIMRLQETGWFPPQALAKLIDIPRSILAEARHEYGNSEYLVLCSALEYMHRSDYETAQKIMEDIPVKPNIFGILFDTTREHCRYRLKCGPQPQLNFEQALMLQEAMNSELSSHFRTVARRELSQYAWMEPQPTQLSAADMASAKRDVQWIAFMAATVCGSLSLFFGYVIFQVFRLVQGQHSAPEPSPSHPKIHCDPLKVCVAYVVMQWLMMILAISLSYVFKFKQSTVLSIFCTYSATYTVLIASIAWVLPRLRTIPVQLSAAQTLEMHRPGWRELAWGIGGFSAAMVTTSLLSQLIARLCGHAPYSENPFLGIAANSHSYEWIMLLLQLSVLGPLFEEILFRGLLFGGLRSCWKTVWAALLSAFLFGATHCDPQGTIVLIGLGLCFAFIYHKSGNLWSSVISHGLWNGFVALNILFMTLN